MGRAGVGTNDASGNQAMTGRRLSNEPRRYWHFYGDFFLDRNSLNRDQCAARADVDCGSKFEQGASVSICPVDKNRKSYRQPLPAPSLVLGFTHKQIFGLVSRVAEITQVADLFQFNYWTLVT